MKYIRINENNAVMEIIPDYHPVFPDIPIEQRYSPDFIAKLIQVSDETPVEQSWFYNPDDQTFSAPPPPEPGEPDPVPPEQVPTWEVLEKENALLKQQVQALTEQAAFHEEIFVELAEVLYA